MSCMGNEDFQDFNKLPSSALGAPLMVAILAIGIAIGSLVFSGSAMAQEKGKKTPSTAPASVRRLQKVVPMR